VRKVLVLSIPVFIGTTLNSITVFIDKFMATWLPEGSIAALNYSVLVQGMFVTVFGATFAQYIYPKMSQSFAAKDLAQWKKQFNNGLGMLFAIGIPIGLGCLAFSHEVIRLIFERGAFDAAATDLTASVFFCYSLSMAFQMLMLFLVQTYYSAHNTKIPVIISSICAVINVVGNLILIGPLGIRGIALSTSFALCVNTITLITVLHKRNPGIIAPGFLRKLVKLFCSSVVAVGLAFAAYKALSILSIFDTSSSSIIQLIHLGAAAAVAVVVYLTSLHLLKVDEIRYLKQTVRDIRGAK
jgi:putative peptidoglycan lipid II flippase